MSDGIPNRQESELDWDAARASLRSRIRAHLGRCDSTTLEDLTQQACVDLLRTVRAEGVRNPPALIAIIARNVAAAEIRRRRRHRLRFADWEVNIDRVLAMPDASGEAWDDSLQLLWFMLLEYLRVNQSTCHPLAVRFGECGSWKVVAEETGVSHDVIRQRWSRCVQRFKDELRKNPGSFVDWLSNG